MDPADSPSLREGEAFNTTPTAAPPFHQTENSDPDAIQTIQDVADQSSANALNAPQDVPAATDQTP